MPRRQIFLALGITLLGGTGLTFSEEIVILIDDICFALVKTLYGMIE